MQIILNIDNSPPGVAERTGMLRSAGYAVIEGLAADGARLLAEHSPALVIAETRVSDSSIPHISASGMESAVLMDAINACLRMSAAEDALRRWNRNVEEFSFAMRHDLQEPLRAINIYTDLLSSRLREHLDDESKRYEFYVRNGVERMERLIRDLLEFSRLMHNEPPACQTVDLEAVLAGISGDARAETPPASITHDLLPTVVGDAALLRQVFGNLISNALTYRRPDEPPAIHITADRKGHWWAISVRDNGIGFEAQYAERIFGLFKRLHGKEYPGTGLGLALCRQVIEQSGGRIWAESEPGKGSVFSFTLPAIPHPTPQAQPATFS